MRGPSSWWWVGVPHAVTGSLNLDGQHAECLPFFEARSSKAGLDGVTVVDFADLGVLPPEARKAAHILAAVNAVADFLTQLTEACDIYLARRIAAQLAETPPDGDGGLDLSLGETATRIATDADPAGWDKLQVHGSPKLSVYRQTYKGRYG